MTQNKTLEIIYVYDNYLQKLRATSLSYFLSIVIVSNEVGSFASILSSLLYAINRTMSRRLFHFMVNWSSWWTDIRWSLRTYLVDFNYYRLKFYIVFTPNSIDIYITKTLSLFYIFENGGKQPAAALPWCWSRGRYASSNIIKTSRTSKGDIE